MSTADLSKDIIQAGTEGAGDDSEKTKDGLSKSHAYTVIGVHTLSDGTRLVKIRNPWGEEGYKGAWSDNSNKWTE